MSNNRLNSTNVLSKNVPLVGQILREPLFDTGLNGFDCFSVEESEELVDHFDVFQALGILVNLQVLDEGGEHLKVLFLLLNITIDFSLALQHQTR